MKFFYPTLFFDLTDIPFASLFDACEPVWESLEQLSGFMRTLPLGTWQSPVTDKVYIENRETVFIGKGVTIEPGAYIKGPCYLGDGTQVRHGAYIRGYVLTGQDCVIGHATEVKNSIFLNKASAAHFNYIGDSVIGNGVNLGAGTRLANLKLNRAEVSVSYQGIRYQTGRRKLGAILGDGVQTGCNAVLNPGTLVHKKQLVLPNASVCGVV